MSGERLAAVRTHLLELQATWCEALEAADASTTFARDELPGERGGMARPWVLIGGDVLESAAAMFSHTSGARLPKAATARRPALTGGSFEAVSLSTIVHPRNPHAPTMHANLRLFEATPPEGAPVWWFGGGFDLTPYYGYRDDVVAWHEAAQRACEVLGPDAYPAMKAACDRYFFLPHRGEARGVGGLFFDDLDQPDFDTAFRFVRAVGEAFVQAYLPVLERRKATPTNQRERAWQTYRRGRYVEFNLLHDRGTLFGLQAGGRTESILASLPPVVTWRYDHQPESGSREAELLEAFLPAREWLA